MKEEVRWDPRGRNPTGQHVSDEAGEIRKVLRTYGARLRILDFILRTMRTQGGG